MSTTAQITLAGPPSLAKGVILAAREPKPASKRGSRSPAGDALAVGVKPKAKAKTNATSKEAKVASMIAKLSAKEAKAIAKAQAKETKALAKEAQARAAKVEKDDVFQVNKELPLHIEALPITHRPMLWNDIPEFASRHKRTIADIVYDLALLTCFAYAQKTKRRTVIPMDLELLVRLYDAYPSSCTWKRPDIRETFEFLYGKIISEFDSQYENVARLAIGRRYARMLGRVDTAQYRWLTEEGKVTRRLENIVAKIYGIADSGADPLATLEALSRNCWALRGVDIEAVVPMPTAQSVIKPAGTRGRRMTAFKKTKPSYSEVYDGGVFG